MAPTAQTERTKFANTWASVHMDLLRGLAALAVLLEHWRNLLFVDFHEIPSHRAWLAMPYVLTGAGHQAVTIFFVLSGFLISRSVFGMFERGTWDWRVYLTHRLVRLWVVLLPGLLLCALWDEIGIRGHLAPMLYGDGQYNHMFFHVAERHTVGLFFSNLFFLQMVRTPIFGSDSSLWSLSYEFWYYMLFPLGLSVVRGATAPGLRLVCAALFLLIGAAMPVSILILAPVWLSGTLLALLPTLRVGARVRVAAALLYPWFFFLIGRQHLISGMAGDYLLAGATFAFLWIVLSDVSPAPESGGVRFSRQISRFSYTLYVVHLPLLVLVTAVVLGDRRWNPSLMHVGAAFGILIAALAYAWGVASLTEFHTDTIRRWTEGKLGLGPSRRLVTDRPG